MVNIDGELLKGLVEQGAKGNVSGFSLLSKRLISKLKKTDIDLAAELSTLLSQSREGLRSLKMPVPIDGDSRRNLLQEKYPVILDVEPMWSEVTSIRLQQVLKEHEFVKALDAEGLSPIKSLLLSGPPGVGKTLAAYWLANKLNLPLLTLDLATVMSSLLGKTGSNIRAVIDYARSFPCVLLLDEFDSVAKKRDDDGDVGELKRLVTVLLQAIDDWPSSSVLIAATNHPDILDPAVWRRFDLILDMDNPSIQMVQEYLLKFGVNSSLALKLAPLIAGASFALIEKMILAAKKQAVLEQGNFEAYLIEQVLNTSNENEEEHERELKVIELHLKGLSRRKIAETIGITHPTVSKIIKKFI